MTCRPAPACKAALAEASRLWPHRDRSSDGICASAQHSKLNRTSDHEPDGDGEATAFDIDHDPEGGFDAAFWAEQLRERQDPRVKYVIYRGRMFSSYSTSSRKAWAWGPYTGPNPHVKHMHVSVVPAYKRSTADWWFNPQPQEEDLTPDQATQLANANHMVTVVIPQALTAIGQAVAAVARQVQGVDAQIPDNLEGEIDEVRKNARAAAGSAADSGPA